MEKTAPISKVILLKINSNVNIQYKNKIVHKLLSEIFLCDAHSEIFKETILCRMSIKVKDDKRWP